MGEYYAVCKNCGQPKPRSQAYYCPACAYYTAQCKRCGKEFTAARRTRAWYCSEYCRQEASIENMLAAMPRFVDRQRKSRRPDAIDCYPSRCDHFDTCLATTFSEPPCNGKGNSPNG